nr:MAG: OncN [Betta papillomavirus 1]
MSRKQTFEPLVLFADDTLLCDEVLDDSDDSDTEDLEVSFCISFNCAFEVDELELELLLQTVIEHAVLQN